MKTTDRIKVRACSIYCIDNPEWGTFGVMDDHGSYYDIHGASGSRVLSKHEADSHWAIVPNAGIPKEDYI